MAGFNAGTGMVWLCSILAGAGAIGLPSITLAQTAPSNIVPDGTLGAERSQVEFRNAGERITGGAARGINLFHSFLEFNVGAGRATYFIAPNWGIENILARVTGRNSSEILGTLGTALLVNGGLAVSNANLFLINPNGIVFRQNARLDVDRSFVATTANAIQFGDQGFFSTSNPTSTSPLLTINPSAFLFNHISPGSIINRSIVPIQSGSTFPVGLRVPNGQTLMLLGGDIDLEGGRLSAFGGRVEIGAVRGSGQVNILPNGNLGLADGLVRANISMTNAARIDVALNNGGEVNITAGNIRLTGESQIFAGIRDGLGTTTSRAGNVRLDATGEIRVEQSSTIFNLVGSRTIGQGGNLDIKTGSLFVNNAQILTSSSGQGNGGNIIITARDAVSIDGLIGRNQPSGILSTLENKGTGKAGDVSISTKSLSITNGAQVDSLTRGQGNAGNVTLRVEDDIFVGSSSSNSPKSAISSTVEPSGIGKGGDISIIAKTLVVNNGAQIINSTFGKGDAGNIIIETHDVISLDGSNTDGFTSSINSNVESMGEGKGGNITIKTGSLFITNGAQIRTDTRGVRKTGSDAGNIIIEARDLVSLDGISKNQFPGISEVIPSVVSSSVDLLALGNGGDITIKTGSLSVTNTAQLNTSTNGLGNAGSITIEAYDSTTFVDSSAISQVQPLGLGNGGDITIKTGSLLVKNGAGISSATTGFGDAGNIVIEARDSVSFSGLGSDGSLAAATVGVFPAKEFNTVGRGKGGNLSITGGSLLLDNAALQAESFGQRNAGNIFISVRDSLQANKSEITTSSTKAGGGEINISARNIFLRNGSNIFSFVSSGAGNGGDITLSAKSIVALEDSNILATARDGKGGNITFNTRAFLGQNYRPSPFITNPFTLIGNNRVDVNASGTVSGIITLPDVSFLQNSLTEFPQTFTDTTQLLANSCIVRSRKQNGKFFITGSGGLPVRPGDAPLSSFPTGGVGGVVEPREQGRQGERREQGKERGGRDEGRGMRDEGRDEAYIIQNSTLDTQNSLNRPWKIGDPIVEPQGVYKLANGELVMSRECP